MKTSAQIAPTGKALVLPMTAVFLVTKKSDRVIAHALDFDLLAVAATEMEAVRKVRLAVERHIEYGLTNNFTLDILQSAPEESWAALTPDATMSIGEPIQVCNYRMRTATKTTENEDKGSLTAA